MAVSELRNGHRFREIESMVWVIMDQTMLATAGMQAYMSRLRGLKPCTRVAAFFVSLVLGRDASGPSLVPRSFAGCEPGGDKLVSK